MNSRDICESELMWLGEQMDTQVKEKEEPRVTRCGAEPVVQ